MEPNPAKRRKTDHSVVDSTLGFEAAAAASAGLFRPSTFILETAELLQQSRVDYGKLLPGSEDLLRDVKNAVESVKVHGPILIGKATKDFEKKHAIRVPYPHPRPADDSQLKVSMEKPAHCNVVGSFVLKTMVRSQRDFAVDMIVEMPKTLFQEKDYLNLRYFYKRAYYLANIAVAVSKATSESLRFSFAYLGNNPLLPILVATRVQPASEAEALPDQQPQGDCKIRIIPCCPDGVFPRQKLLATKNCLRLEAAPDGKDPPPTPFYNGTLKAEAGFVPYLKLLHQAQKSCSGFADACMLGRVWLQQRGFGGSAARGGFGAFEWAALVALLLQTGHKKARVAAAGGSILSPSLSSTQIFKAVIQFLAATDFRSRPCVVGGPTPDVGLDALREGTPVLYDAGRQLNVAYKMSPWSAALLRQHARWTHELLRDEGAADADPFTPTFIARADIAIEAYDMVFRVRHTPPPSDEAPSTSRRGRVWEFGDSVFQVLKKALGDRAKLVHVQLPTLSAWTLDAAAAETVDATDAFITVGVVFDPTNMARHIDQGPDAEDKKEARKFRQFWGERAELRRFQDGSILETLVWNGRAAEALCEEITRYILGERLRLGQEDIAVLGGGFAPLVPLAPAADASTFALAREAFATLEQDLRSLEDLPLHIRQLAPIDRALRSASLRLPAVQSAAAPLFPMEVVLFFEASGKWPDNLAAIQRAKVAFMLRIGESLESSKAGIVTTHLGLEDVEDAKDVGADADADADADNLAFLDIVYADTAAFRLRIHSDLEASLLERRSKDKTQPPHARTAAAQRLAAHRRLYEHLPRHTQTIATYATRFPALAPTIRLVQRWFSAHKLSCHVSDELVELLVLHVFLRPAPWQAPVTAAPGLLRTLQFLARWDWHTEPLVVDTSASSPVDETGAVPPAAAAADTTADPRNRLAAWRKIDPNMNHTVLFVSTTHETTGTAFTTAAGGSRPLPSKVVAARMSSLARAAARLVRETDAADLDPHRLFQTSLRDYDVLLHLSPRVVKRLVNGEVTGDDDNDDGAHERRSIYKNLDTRTGRVLHPLPAHPVQLLLGLLNQAYASGHGSTTGPIVFFHGAPEAGDYTIGGIWNPQMQKRTFRVNLPSSFKPIAGSAKKSAEADAEADATDPVLVEINREGILAEIARIGGSLIERVEVVEKH